VLHDLVDALLLENLFGLLRRGEVGPAGDEGGLQLERGERLFRLLLAATGGVLAFRVRRERSLPPYRLSRPPVIALQDRETRRLSPDELLALLAVEAGDGKDAFPNLGAALDDLRLSVTQGELALQATPRVLDDVTCRPSSLGWERLVALRDRPFHPTARAKRGWDAATYTRFAPEFARPFGLDWIAVRQDHLASGSLSRSDPDAELLEPVEHARMAEALAVAGLEPAEYVPIPVHPWQARHVLPQLFETELRDGILRLVARDLGSFVATSSIRTLARPDGGTRHVKLPLAIYSLGALRLLPRRYLENAERAQMLLELLADRHPVAALLSWCDEQRWWSFRVPGEGELDDRSGQLGCLIRMYPQELVGDPGVTLLPMAALAVPGFDGVPPALAHLLRDAGGTGAGDALELFSALCTLLTRVALTCFAHGVMPELHGQNILLVWRQDAPAGLLLRDHDTLRIHPPWLARSGLPVPRYRMRAGTQNTLVASTPEELLAWYQTLGVEVTLAAIGEVICQAFGLDPAIIWSEVRSSVDRSLTQLDLPTWAREVAQAELLERETWPVKLLLGPLLQKSGADGSMPSALARMANPLHGLAGASLEKGNRP
jgi:siderophore synthetase component